jgi:ATP-binding cassette subfamily B protein
VPSATTITNLILFLEFGIIIGEITVILEPLTDKRLNILYLTIFFIAGILVAILHFLCYKRGYNLTYTAANNESSKIRLEIAERIRKLPLSFLITRI